MRRLAVKTLALALVLGVAGIGLAQQQPGQPGQPPAQPGQPGQPRQPGMPPAGMPGKKKPPEKSKLEETLAEALKNNPDIRVAAAKLAEAEAELNRARVQVTQQVVMLHQSILSQKAAVDLEQKKYDRMKGLLDDRAIDARIADEALAKLTVAKAKLAELEAQMPGLLGRTARAADATDATRAAAFRALLEMGSNSGSLSLSVYDVPKATGPMADKIRKALQTPVTVDYKSVTFASVLKDLEKKAPGLTFHNRYETLNGTPLTLSFDKPLPVAAVLEVLEDNLFNIGKNKDDAPCFVIRQYGILITARGNRPPGALTVQEFMRQKPAEK